MLRTRSTVGSILVVLAFALVGAGCGGGDDSGSPLDPAAGADETAPDSTAAVDAAADTDSGSDSGALPSGDGAPQLAQGAWEGTLHVDVSGDVDFSVDYSGGGQTQGEFTIFTFTSDDGKGAQLAFTAGSNDEAALLVNSSEFTGGGEIGEGKVCNLSLSKNDDSAAEGSVTCKGAEGLNSGVESLHVDIASTFTVTQP